jgi:hypothetical protein
MSLRYISGALRQLVFERANGCCEYCLIPETVAFATHEIDHIIAKKHRGPTESGNLALSCAVCNKQKGSDLSSIDPETQQIVPLFHPRWDRWADHFSLERARIHPLTPKARATAFLLQLNAPERITERELLIRADQLRVPNE